MHLVGYISAGPCWHHNGSWRHPESDAVDCMRPERYETIARILEEGLFDGVFMVDVQTMFDSYGGTHEANTRQPGQFWFMEPMQTLAAMARVTSRLGLAATMSTTLYPPYHIARAFSTLDHISNGRAGWNIVTSTNDGEARNFGLDTFPDKSLRYDLAEEVVEACNKLWESWEPDAIIYDREEGIWADPAKIRRVDFEGRFVKTRGPLAAPRSPQTRPVFMQAGSSERGREFAGRHAEVIFTLQHDRSHMQAFYQDIKSRVVAHGRPAHHCAVLPAIDVIVGETESIAKEKQAYINSLVSPELGVAEISNGIGIDLSNFPLDQPIQDMEITQGARGVFDVILQGSKTRNLTLRDAGRAYGESQMTPQIAGTARQIADHMQSLFEDGCCDGFIVIPSLSPSGYQQFVKHVVPELQKRGIFRDAYRGTTFREHLQG